MAGRDRREDPGQYYPGGSVVPKTPTGQGGGGTSDYDQLANKPKINNHELIGNKTAAQLGLAAQSDILGKLPLRALPPYLHYLTFDDTYPADAAWLYAQLGPSDLGRCSAVRRGGKMWRNYDWTFDDAAEFVVKMSGNSTRFASVGVASVGSRLTENDVMSAVNSRYYKCLPGMTLDGINEKGVVCEINVDGGPKYGWHGDAADEGIHILAAVRWALDHGETAEQAAEWIADHVIQPQGEMNFHFMVADATSTYIVENGAAYDMAHGTKVLTNYALFDSAHAGGGKERYQLLAGGADISAVNFTNAYQSGNDWDSDFDSHEQHAEAIRQWAAQGTDKEAHRGKTTTGGKAWWQSVHTTEYDFASKTMKVAVQEQDDWYVFAVDQANVDLAPIEAQVAALQDGKRDKTDEDAYKRVQCDDWTFSGSDYDPTATYTIQIGLEDPDFSLYKNGVFLAMKAQSFDSTEVDFSTGGYSVNIVATRPTAWTIDTDTAHKLAKRTANPTSGAIAKFDADGNLVGAEQILPQNVNEGDYAGPTFAQGINMRMGEAEESISGKRDLTDNTCHKTEFTEWKIDEKSQNVLDDEIVPYYTQNPIFTPGKGWCADVHISGLGEFTTYGRDESENAVENVFNAPGPVITLRMSRSAVCTSGKKFVTEDVAALKSDIPALATPSESATDTQAAKARATYDFVNSSINAMAAFYITKNAAGDSFATKAELTEAIASGTFYNGGQPRVPTKNDYLYILADESHPTAAGTNPTTRYSFDGTQWSFQIVVNDTALTAAQLNAINSGINAALVTWLTQFKGTDTATTLASILAKLAHLENDGTADDDFVTDLLGKPVAKSAIIKECLYDEYTVPKTGDDAYDLHANASNLLVFNSSQTSYTFDLSAHLPQKVNGKLMDFFIELNTDAPVTVSTNAADTAKIRGDSPSVSEAGNYWITFSTKADGTIYIRNIKMEAPQS